MKYNVCVIGLGYVGLVTAVKIALTNNNVFGIENDPTKNAILKKGKVHFFEPKLEPKMRTVLQNNKLKLFNSLNKLDKKCDVFMVCVGTPADKKGNFDYKFLEKTCHELIKHLKNYKKYFIIVVRSTTLPGKSREIFVKNLSKKLQLKIGKDFDVVMNPEFLREGSAYKDYDNPSRTVLGVSSPKCVKSIKQLYKNISAPFFVTDLETAELCKYIDNSWHALKVTFGNEIGAIANALKIKSSEIYDIFTSDTKLNISKAYLRPGFAFGGSCLPKDLRALQVFSSNLNLNLPLLNSIDLSNIEVLQRLINVILNLGKNNLSILGITFKMQTDDYRDSPIIKVIEMLKKHKRYNIKVYDELLSNLKYPNFKNLNDNVKVALSEEECIINSDVILIFHKNNNYIQSIKKYGHTKIVIDLVGISEISNLKNYITLN